MRHILTVSETWLRRVHELFLNRRSGPLVYPVGRSLRGNTTEWFGHSATAVWPAIGELTVAAGEIPEQLPRLGRLNGIGDRPAVALSLGAGRAAGYWFAQVFDGDVVRPCARFRVIVSGLPVFTAANARETARQDEESRRAEGARPYWRRTIAALGDATWNRIRALRVAVIGAGRTGSAVAMLLAQLGARVAIVDDDRLQPHNLGEVSYGNRSAVGRSKAKTVAATIRRRRVDPTRKVQAISTCIQSYSGWQAVCASDVIVSCVDSPLGRWHAAAAASLFLRPHIDVGAGVIETDQGRSFGSDVRLTWPGRCLVCFGGIDGLRMEDGRLRLVSETRRLGNLASVSTIAAGFAVRLLEALAGGDVRENAWIRCRSSEQGMPQVEWLNPAPSPALTCPLCRLAGAGDQGLARIPRTESEIVGNRAQRRS